MDAMKYNDLRDFLTLLEQQGELKRITLPVDPHPVDPHLEITEIADRTLRAGGPALLFENPKGYSMPVLCNLFGTPKRVAMGMGQEDVSALREVGKLLAFLKEPEPPKGFRDLFDKLPQFKQVLNMPTKRLRGAPCQQKIVSGDDVDLNRIPIMTCWPEDAGTLRAGGPALLFENPKGYSMPVLCNLFGTPKRVAMGMGQEDVSALREVGKLLAFLKEPEPPKGFRDLFDKLPQFKQVLNMPTKRLRGAPCQQKIVSGDDVDLNRIPIMTCWPEDAAPLITWGLTVTRGPHKERQNLGIYRQQLIGKNKLIMRWLSHRGGALDYQEWCAAHPGERFPVSVALGADPATILGAVTPVPDTLSEYAFAGLLRGTKTEVVKCISNDLEVPASAEIVLEGYIEQGETAPEGPYGDHTGYYKRPKW